MSQTRVTAGASTFVFTTADGKECAVLEGHQSSEPQYTFYVKTDAKSARQFYVHAATRSKTWLLPDLVGKNVKAAPRTLRDRVVAFYTRYNPTQLSSVDATIKAYNGDEEKLMRALTAKYGAEPTDDLLPGRDRTPSQCSAVSGSGDVGATQEDSLAASAAPLPPPLLPSNGPAEEKASVSAIRRRVIAMYEKYAPSKLSQADRQLQRYEGQELELIKALVAKYGPEDGANAKANEGQPLPTEASASTRSDNSVGASQLSIRERVVRMYLKYKPEKVGAVDAALATYAGQEDVLLKVLVDKYGPEPPENEEVKSAAPAPPSTSKPEEPREKGNTSAASPTPIQQHTDAAPDGSARKLEEKKSFPSPSPAAEGRLPPRHSTSPAQSAQEQLLLSFLSDRDARLHDAMERYERSLATIDELKADISRMHSEAQALRESHETEIEELKRQAESALAQAAAAEQRWKMEMELMGANAELAKVAQMRDINKVKMLVEEEHRHFVDEEAAVKQELHMTRAEYEAHQRKTRDLLAVLSRKDTDLQKALHEVESLRTEIFTRANIAKASKETQTIAVTILQETFEDVERRVLQAGAEGPTPVEQSNAVVAEFDAMMGTQRFEREEIDAWQQRVTILERELEDARDSIAYLQDQAAAENEKKHRAIAALRNRNVELEHKISELELKIMAQPDADLAAPPEMSTLEKVQLQNEVVALKSELDAARASAKDSQREIKDLRGLLSVHMAAHRKSSSRSPLMAKR